MKQTLEFKGSPKEILQIWKDIVNKTNFCFDDKHEAITSQEDLMDTHLAKMLTVTIHYK